ncbi:Rab5-interacting protein family like protein [Aduncisulcus paluster]|uniref:Rab5-interacting protein family like protein n=1 Tax=Aduncisulcus paluster TaxID=2918883 RepID=A0ABQ5KHC0_9EUKA|nr:Rab5-interacting protein family like protein [Aduncisulcus paluster]
MTSAEMRISVSLFKYLISTLVGIIWGSFQFTGLISIIFAVFAVVIVQNLWYEKFLKLNIDLYGGRLKMHQEGLNMSVSGFALAWVVCYTLSIGF